MSHISLIVQPAPLIIKAMEPNIIKDLISGKSAGNAANAMLHPNGQNNNQQPVKQNSTLVKLIEQEARATYTITCRIVESD